VTVFLHDFVEVVSHFVLIMGHIFLLSLKNNVRWYMSLLLPQIGVSFLQGIIQRVVFALRRLYMQLTKLVLSNTLVYWILSMDFISSVKFKRAIFIEIYTRLTIYLNLCIHFDDIF
jgi:hypothetical protein